REQFSSSSTIHQGCHPDRSATRILVPPEVHGAEWRDPEGASLIMLPQGVLPLDCPGHVWPSRNAELNEANQDTCRNGRHWQSGENALTRHGEGHSLGIPPLRAKIF